MIPEARGLLYTTSCVTYYCGGRLPLMQRASMLGTGRGCCKPVNPTTTPLSDTSHLLPMHLLLEANDAASHCSWLQTGVTTGEIDEEGQFQKPGPLVSLILLHLNKGCVPEKCQSGCSCLSWTPCGRGAHGYVQIEVTRSQVPAAMSWLQIGC